MSVLFAGFTVRGMTINYITNQSLDSISGGWNGNNARVYAELARRMTVNYVGPVHPPVDRFEAGYSRLRRLMGLKGGFAAFSHRRLSQIAREVDVLKYPSDYCMFWGQMPWLYCAPAEPYGVYLDVPFRSYVRIFLEEHRFQEKELCRIEQLEARWLANARHVFWGSQWALDQASAYKALGVTNSRVVWVGGNLEIPPGDEYRDSCTFLFVALRFREKGGMMVWEAFRKVRERHPECNWVIAGASPPPEVLATPGVVYAGMFRKESPDELEQFRALMAGAFCLVHPTSMDTLGQVIIEAGYHGCPAIAPARFGIPELIHHQQTGILLPEHFTVQDVAAAMEWMLDHPSEYLHMRREVRAYSTGELTFDRVGEKISSAIMEVSHE